jgi:hypothetical protein
VLLPDGDFLICGGQTELQNLEVGEVLNTIEVWNASLLQFDFKDTPMTSARRFHTCTLVYDEALDKYVVLMAGGESAPGVPVDTWDLWDPDSDEIIASGTMNAARFNHTATVLIDGTVLFAGGGTTSSALETTEIYNPSSRTFSPGTNMNARRTQHTATLLHNGDVLLTGGEGSFDTSIDIYDYTASSFVAASSLPTMVDGRNGHKAAQMEYYEGFARFTNGSATVTGILTSWNTDWVAVGDLIVNNDTNVPYEITAVNSDTSLTIQKLQYDNLGAKVTGTAYTEASTTFVDYTILHRDVFIVGGSRQSNSANPFVIATEWLDVDVTTPASSTFAATTAETAVGRYGHTLIPLADGRMVIVGGVTVDDSVAQTASAMRSYEIWTADTSADPFTGADAMSASAAVDANGFFKFHVAARLGNGTVMILRDHSAQVFFDK